MAHATVFYMGACTWSHIDCMKALGCWGVDNFDPLHWCANSQDFNFVYLCATRPSGYSTKIPAKGPLSSFTERYWGSFRHAWLTRESHHCVLGGSNP